MPAYFLLIKYEQCDGGVANLTQTMKNVYNLFIDKCPLMWYNIYRNKGETLKNREELIL